jgi:hypothetical protein
MSEFDKGELNSEILRKYEREVLYDQRAMEENSDDEEDVHVSMDWPAYHFLRLTINVCENVP